MAVKRQVCLGNGGIADIVAVERYQSGITLVDIYEVKVGDIGVDEIEQAFRYAHSVDSWYDQILEEQAMAKGLHPGHDFRLNVFCVGRSLIDRPLTRFLQARGYMEFLKYRRVSTGFEFQHDWLPEIKTYEGSPGIDRMLPDLEWEPARGL